MSKSRLPERFFERIVEHVADPIFVKDRHFRFVYVNAALSEMVGRTNEEMTGKTDYDFFPRAEADNFRAKDEEMFRTGARVRIDQETVTHAGGQVHVVTTTKVPLADEDGTVTHMVGIIHDITEAQELLMRKERLAVLGQLAGGVAHQIRNPLSAIKNAAYVIERLTENCPLDAHARAQLAQAIAVIHDEVQGANQTVTALLDHARARHAVRRPVPVREVVDGVIAAVPTPERVAVVRELGDAADAVVAVDADQVRGALGNVVRNAIEAMPAGGTLTVSARREGDKVVLRFADTGPGIAPEIRARLFEPLVTTKPLGLGLGLVTARTLIMGQGGTLEAEPGEPGSGAVLLARLPVA